MTTIDYSDSTPDVAFTYTRLGQHLTITDAAGAREFAYSATTLELLRETLPAQFYGDRVLTRAYDALGRDTGLLLGTVASPAASQDVAYSFDGFGRFSGVTVAAPVARAFAYSYLEIADLLETVTFPGGITATKAYEAHRNLMASIENKSGATTVSRYEYANDAAGRRTQAGWTGTAFEGQPDSIAYGYNPRSELTSADATNRAQYLFGYGYDPIGNRQQSSVGDPPAGKTYAANSLNQYTAVSGLTSPVYDNDGNMTLMPSLTGDWALSWDGENRLVRAESAATRLDFVYDHQFRRIGKAKYTREGEAWVPAEDVRFIYDGWNMIECGTVVDSAWSPAQVYIWGLDLSQTLQGAGGIGGLLARHDVATSATQYYTFDGNGNVSELLEDGTGTIAAHYEYGPFGNTFAETGPLATTNPYRFSTKYLDTETGLYYYGYRFLSTEILGAVLIIAFICKRATV